MIHPWKHYVSIQPVEHDDVEEEIPVPDGAFLLSSLLSGKAQPETMTQKAGITAGVVVEAGEHVAAEIVPGVKLFYPEGAEIKIGKDTTLIGEQYILAYETVES